ncbi:MAG TPA: glycosyltransferase family 4 protein [Acidimicrobiales bacterium]|nr:glycosyltransferase family 4 protein [Acidimicrobiales bacterium]
MRHLLVTNDYPPKIGGIQNYLWELWRRLPPDDVTVLTTRYHGSAAFDRAAPHRIERMHEPVLLPSLALRRRVAGLAAEVGAQAVVLDPALPLSVLGPWLGLPYAVVLHGAEVTVPGRLPVSKQVLGQVLQRARLLISAGGYPEAEARHAIGAGPVPPVVQVPPGVDTARFVPLDEAGRAAARARFGLPAGRPLVVSVSRLVPRKGMDTLIDAAALLAPDHPGLTVAIAGGGRDRRRLDQRIASAGAPVRMLGRVADADLPALYAAADVFVLLCRTRWAGLEQEGFGIVLLEAAAAGVAAVAGRRGGAAEAVDDGVTGLIVDPPDDAAAAAAAIGALLADPARRAEMGAAARARAERRFAYDTLACHLQGALASLAVG